MAWIYREVQIEDDKSIGDSGTETIDLNLKDPITSLIIRFKVTNTSALTDQPPQRIVSKIEIVDGGQVYYSLSGQQAVAATAYGLGRYPYCWLDGRSGNNQRMKFQLLFGRYLGDEQYAFDPSRLLNPQLKVTWAKHATHTTLLCTLGVTARIMEGLSAPPQALMWKEVEAWTTAASGDHKVDLPVDYIYRALMHRVWASSGVWSTMQSHFKIDCDLGKFIPLDLDSDEYRDITKSFMGPFKIPMHGTWDCNTLVQSWLGETLDVNINSSQYSYFANALSAGAWPYFYAYFTDVDGGFPSACLAQTMATGYYPESCVLYPFGRLDSPETWFDPRGYGEIAFKITEATASAAASVAVQQVRPIP